MSKLLKSEEICKFLNVTRKTLYNYRDKGMPYIKNGGSVLYDKDAVEEWLKCGRYDAEKRKQLLDAIKVLMRKAETVLCEYCSLINLLKDKELFIDKEGKRNKEVLQKRLNNLEKFYNIEDLQWHYNIAIHEKILFEEKIQKVNYDLTFKLCRDLTKIFRNARAIKKEEGDSDVSNKK
ncbi:DNA-binding protein [Clostridium botulinum]|uniref:DNA-binding protein n=1 Tax=Clostridium botulinum TaxID=1491 RepID=A0A6M0SN49_CLOBO|nr:DNA-binding protein [Clostridium botulinum]